MDMNEHVQPIAWGTKRSANVPFFPFSQRNLPRSINLFRDYAIHAKP